LVIFVTLQTLGWSGYQSPPDDVIQFSQPESALMAIRLMVSLLGALVLAGSIALAWSYPLSRERHERIQKLLKRRREEKI
jgi:GPH family glycoside/pentoside/hexuronide:cation symporter